ncbi:MAG: 50S ribosomal protein L31 [Rhodospirillales bacterium]|nr:50S ribosomal protein L31 [Rhodospirillales bacterium]MCB9995748.1 50S ribosomal protein L31 [Rhodospirillales bacterium]
MKAEVHPDYHEITVVLTDGTEYKTHSTWGKEGDVMKLDIDCLSHPAWNGGSAKVIEKGQLTKFESRYGNLFGAGDSTAKKEEKKDEE